MTEDRAAAALLLIILALLAMALIVALGSLPGV
jgi:hypothetical protein